MNIEPLQPILRIYKDKNKVFQKYLEVDTKEKIKNHIYYDEKGKDLYLNDNLILIQKNTGKVFKKGKIIAILEKKITLQTSTGNLNVRSDNYYIFIKEKKNKSSNRDFYKALLNQL